MPPLVPTVKIKELQPLTVGLALNNADKIPIHISSEDKTKRVSLQELSQFLVTGGGGTVPPAVWGAEVIYQVNSLAAGGDTASITSLAGKDFSLERMGVPMIPLLADLSNAAVADFEILTGGGFKLTSNQPALTAGERFKLQVFSLISTTPGTTVQPFLRGKRVISTTAAIDPVDDANKIIQFRGSTSYITCTLPDIVDIPENTVFILETSIGQDKPVTVSTTGGQYFYFNGQSKTTIYMMPGEVCWIYRDVDGFYFLNDFAERYKNIGNPVAAFKRGANQVVFNGDIKLRADYPRLFEEVQTFGLSYITKSLWDTASATVDGRTVLRPYRGCWNSGDGSTTFGLPDMMNSFLRSVATESGTDSQRQLNKPGGFQDNTVKVPDDLKALKITGTFTFQTGDNSPGEPNLVASYNISTGPENRPDNIGVLWVCNV